jgi:hypothetical protein
MAKCTKKQIRRLKTALHWKGCQRIQMVLLRESGMTQPAIADAMGVSLSTVNRAHMAAASRVDSASHYQAHLVDGPARRRTRRVLVPASRCGTHGAFGGADLSGNSAGYQIGGSTGSALRPRRRR